MKRENPDAFNQNFLIGPAIDTETRNDIIGSQAGKREQHASFDRKIMKA
jgi:hypothetical protein